MKRPYTDAFLTAVYAHYDLCIWSQTSWRWLELKLTEMGFLSNPNYRSVLLAGFMLETQQGKEWMGISMEVDAREISRADFGARDCGISLGVSCVDRCR